MKYKLHKSEDRGTAYHGWLMAKFSFSFAEYVNPSRMGFGPLRVLNNDIITPAQGFSPHTHNNMEIITIPLHGQLLHTDSTGAEEVIRQGQIQVMSAGSGIMHSEYNHSQTKNLELFQIWIIPHTKNVQPGHQTLDFYLQKNEFTQIVSGNKNDAGAFIHQDASLHLGKFAARHTTEVVLKPNRGIFIMIIEGSVDTEDQTLHKRDSLELSEVSSTQTIKINMKEESYILLLDLPL